MSLSDFSRTDADDIVTVLRLAALIDDRSAAEQKALDRLAAKVDRQRNRQTRDNPWMPQSPGMIWHGYRPVCTYSTDHPKSCPCRGDGRAWEPACGWSRLAEEVVS